MKKTALIILAEGFEEIEAVTPADILRRAGIKVTIAGLKRKSVKGAHGITIETDILFTEYKTLPDVVIFPGGMPGAENLAASLEVKELILKMNAKKKLIAAICASPAILLAPTGIMDGRKATCFTGFEKIFSSAVKFINEKTVSSGNIITSRGAGTAADFGLKIVETLITKSAADMIAQQMLYAPVSFSSLPPL